MRVVDSGVVHLFILQQLVDLVWRETVVIMVTTSVSLVGISAGGDRDGWETLRQSSCSSCVSSDGSVDVS